MASFGSKDGKQKDLLTLSYPIAILSLLIILLTLVWLFFMGFMIGRGQNPEKHLEEIAGIIQSNRPAQEVKPTNPEAKTPQETGLATAPKADEQQKSPAAASVVAGAVAGAATAGALVSPQTATGQEKPKPAEKQPALDEPSFTFSYRLATLKTKASATREQKRYAAKGITCQIQAGKKTFSLVSFVRGTDKDDQAFRQKIKAAGLGTPVLLNKKKR